MPEIKHRQINPSPEIEYAEICIPDDKDWGTGTWEKAMEENVNRLLKGLEDYRSGK